MNAFTLQREDHYHEFPTFCLSRAGNLLLLMLLMLLALPSGAQILRINELALEAGLSNSWIELRNSRPVAVRTKYVSLQINQWLVNVPAATLDPFGVLLVALDTANHQTLGDSSSLLTLRVIENGIKGDSITIPWTPTDYAFARLPEESETFVYVPKNRATPGSKNEYVENWQRIVQTSPFGPRDSSPDASLLFDGRFWIFGGFQYKDKQWASSSEVWSSDDGRHWNLVVESPPFSPYSAFVAFRGHMWAIESSAYRSKDGVTWEFMGKLPLEDGGRLCRLNRTLFWLKKDAIFSSNDAVNWKKISENLPFDNRTWPGFIAFRDKLWVIGGGVGYGTDAPEFPNDVWSSSDGIEWERLVQHAEWPGRYWFNCSVFDNRIWVIGGWNYYNSDDPYAGNQNDIWYSTDGVTWTLQENREIWGERHASFVWQTKDYLYFSSGYGGRGLETLYNDFWRMAASSTSATSLFAEPVAPTRRFTIYPNPSSGQFSIKRTRENNRIDEIQVSIIDNNGRNIARYFFSSFDLPLSLSLPLVPGSYVVRICEDGACDTDKLIIL